MTAAAQGRITYRPVVTKPAPLNFIDLLGQMRIGCAQHVALEFLFEIIPFRSDSRENILCDPTLRGGRHRVLMVTAITISVWLAKVESGQKAPKVPRMKSFTLENIRVSKVSCIKRYAYQKFRV